MIEDEELRDLFRAEAGEHLAGLEAGLLRLERGDADAELLDQVFRDAHSLKGAARMLALDGIEGLLHAMEELLRDARDRRSPPPAATIDGLLAALDGAKALVAEAVGAPLADAVGAPDAGLLVDALRSAAAPTVELRTDAGVGFERRSEPLAAAAAAAVPADTPAADPPAGSARMPLPEPTAEAAPAALHAAAAVPPAAGAHSGDAASGWRIDTIRVPTRKLDGLLRRCGELIVSQQRVAGWEEELRQLAESLDGLRRELRLAASERRPPTSEAQTAASLVRVAERLRQRARDDGRRLEMHARSLAEGVREARLLPVATLFELFPRMVRDIARAEGKQVELCVEGGDTSADKQVLEQLKDPLMHSLRNAVHHGIEPPAERRRAGKPERGRILLAARRQGASVQIEVSDDGRGVDAAEVRAAAERLETQGAPAPAAALDGTAAPDSDRTRLLDNLFRPGLSTARMITDISGRGVGLDVVRVAVEQLKGSVRIDSEPGRSFRLLLELPITLATTRVLLLQVGDQRLALPMESTRALLRQPAAGLYRIEGRAALDWRGQALSALDLRHCFDPSGSTGRAAGDGAGGHAVVIEAGQRRAVLLVDEVVAARDVLLRPIGGVLRRLRGIAGATILTSGEVCPVLSATDLLGMAEADPGMPGTPQPQAVGADGPPHRVLLAEGSMLTRLQEKRLLESAGYRVTTAVDGQDAWDKLRVAPARSGERGRIGTQGFEALVADVNMSRLDGLALTARIRADARLQRLPVVLVTSLASADDQRRGLEAGADAYIAKGGFNSRLLLATIERLL